MDDCLDCCISVLVCEQLFKEVCVIFGFHSYESSGLGLIDKVTQVHRNISNYLPADMM
jgi:hypothetical protein